MSPRNARGFSLIELLVTVGIIALMAAILMPVLISAKHSAQRSGCQSNLRQIGKAIDAYCADYKGYYPNNGDPFRRFRWPLKKYVAYSGTYNPADSRGALQTTRVWNSIFRCPADPSPQDTYDATSYGYSASFYHTPDQIDSMTTGQLYSGSTPECASVKASALKFPTKKAMCADWISSHSDEKVGWWSWGGARNYLFADGHGVFLEAKRILPAASVRTEAKRDGDSAYPDINLTTHGAAGKDID